MGESIQVRALCRFGYTYFFTHLFIDEAASFTSLHPSVMCFHNTRPERPASRVAFSAGPRLCQALESSEVLTYTPSRLQEVPAWLHPQHKHGRSKLHNQNTTGSNMRAIPTCGSLSGHKSRATGRSGRPRWASKHLGVV